MLIKSLLNQLDQMPKYASLNSLRRKEPFERISKFYIPVGYKDVVNEDLTDVHSVCHYYPS